MGTIGDLLCGVGLYTERKDALGSFEGDMLNVRKDSHVSLGILTLASGFSR